MGLSVTFVSGPRRSGKSALVQMMVDRLFKRKPHYIRLVEAGGPKARPVKSTGDGKADCGVSSARWVEYDEARVFEIIPEVLTQIHRVDRFGSVLIEADSDPILRWAYPYDHRVFVMPVPSALGDVLRNSESAAIEFQRVLDDTQAFASEVFGLDVGGDDGEPREERRPLSKTQLGGLLRSPLGDELVTRVQLQPSYAGLVESDVVVVNRRIGELAPESQLCIMRVENLLDRLRAASGRRAELFHCDFLDADCAISGRLYQALRPMCQGGK